MGETVNFNRFRKNRAGEEAARKAGGNRIRHARAKNKKQRDKAETTDKDHERHKEEPRCPCPHSRSA